MQFFTIGVFNSNEQEFFNKLVKNRIDTFCDIRQRRGVRGAEYSFVNSNKLQKRLSDLGIQYAHITGLAPTQEIREIQNQMDLDNHISIRQRKQLGKAFTKEYKNRILNKFDFKTFLGSLDRQGSKRVVFFCVEEAASACHRSLVAEKLQNDFNIAVKNL